MSQRIADARIARGLSRRALAKLCGVHLAQVSRWELGDTIPHASILPALCGVLGLQYADLLGDVVQPPRVQVDPHDATLQAARQQRARIVAALSENARIIQSNAVSHPDRVAELARAQGWREAAYLADVTALVSIE